MHGIRTARRPSARWLLALVLAPAFLLAMPGVSNASAPTPNYRLAQVFPNPGFLLSQWPGVFDAGDCELDGTDTWAQLERPIADNDFTSFVNWHAIGLTRHTNNADVWYATFNYLDHLGNIILTVGPLRGGRMTIANRRYEWLTRSGEFHLDPAIYNQIVSVQWKGEC